MQAMSTSDGDAWHQRLELTTVGFGAWAAGGGGWSFGWGPQDDAASIAAMRHAIDRGVNWIDTAAVYGLGHSEEVVGQFLRTLPPRRPAARVHQVRTGVGSCRSDEDRRGARCTPIPSDANVRRRCDGWESSAIDLYQFHWPDEGGMPVEDSWDAMIAAGRAGQSARGRACRISAWRCSNGARRVRHVDSLQPPFSMIKREAAGARAAVVRGPRNRRHLLQPDAVGHSDRHVQCGACGGVRPRRLAPARRRNFKSPQLERNLALRDALQPIAARHHTTVGAIAIAWVLTWPGVTGAIVGARSPEQVDGWLPAATLTLDAADL